MCFVCENASRMWCLHLVKYNTKDSGVWDVQQPLGRAYGDYIWSRKQETIDLACLLCLDNTLLLDIHKGLNYWLNKYLCNRKPKSSKWDKGKSIEKLLTLEWFELERQRDKILAQGKSIKKLSVSLVLNIAHVYKANSAWNFGRQIWGSSPWVYHSSRTWNMKSENIKRQSLWGIWIRMLIT